MKKELIKKLISKGETEKAIQVLLVETKKHDSRYNHILLISNRYQELKSKTIKNIINTEDANIELSKINNGLLEIIDTEIRPSQTQKKQYLLAFFMIAILLVSYKYSQYKAISIKGEVYINNDLQKGVSVSFEDFNISTITNKQGVYFINIPKFRETNVRFIFQELDTLVKFQRDETIYYFKTRNIETKDTSIIHEDKNTINKIINSKKSVIQTCYRTQKILCKKVLLKWKNKKVAFSL
jgi:hypothetical protein